MTGKTLESGVVWPCLYSTLLSPGGVSPPCPGAPCPWLSSGDHFAALPCRCAQLCSPGISHGWLWSHRGSQLPCSLGSPMLLSLLPVRHWDTNSSTLSWGRQGWDTLTKLGGCIQPWVMPTRVWVTFLLKFCQQVHPRCRVQTARSRGHHSLRLYSSRHKANALSLMKVSTCSCTINNNLNIVCLSSSGWAWSDHFGKMEQLSSKNTYLKNYSGRSETYKLINELELGWRLWWEEKFSSQKEGN